VEALYATLLAYELTGHDWCLAWHKKVADWAWSHFPMPNCGEWYQRLNRLGQPISEVIALPVKDPFHLPRGAIMIVQLMEEPEAGQGV
jgi:N-acylglucosamine 2-epimerase